MSDDDRHLDLLAIFHYVLAGLMALLACFPMIYLVLGIVILVAPDEFQGGPAGPPPPVEVGWILVAIGGVAITIGWTIAILIFAAGRCLARRTRHMFCLIIAALECLWMPFGTILGIFTLIVLLRPSVKELFEGDTSEMADLD